VVVDRDEVDEERGAADESREEERRHDHLPDPFFSAHSGVKTSARITVYRGSGGVNEDGCAQQRSASRTLGWEIVI
jgi:hypothetical protein